MQLHRKGILEFVKVYIMYVICNYLIITDLVLQKLCVKKVFHSLFILIQLYKHISFSRLLCTQMKMHEFDQTYYMIIPYHTHIIIIYSKLLSNNILILKNLHEGIYFYLNRKHYVYANLVNFLSGFAGKKCNILHQNFRTCAVLYNIFGRF